MRSPRCPARWAFHRRHRQQPADRFDADDVGVYFAYAAGLALVVGVLAVAVAVASSALIDRMRRVLPYVNRISGAVMVIVGLYVTWYGWFEIRLFSATGSAGDPVITAAGRVQRVLAGWVYEHGAWPWLLVLCAVLASAVWGWTRTKNPRGGPRGLFSSVNDGGDYRCRSNRSLSITLTHAATKS